MGEAADRPSPPGPGGEGSEGNAFYLLFGAFTLLLAMLPQIIGWLTTPSGHVYTGLTTNIDDSAVYLTYMRQAAEGGFFQRNQFTTETQPSYLFNLLFLLLGNIARFTGLSLPLIYNLGRLIAGTFLLWALVALIRETIHETRSRRIAFALACISGGLGFLFFNAPVIVYQKPVDVWQPEAHLFPSLRFSVLFVAALAFMVLFAVSFLRAERTGRWRDLWPAALSAVLLANFHSYDVVPLFAAAFAYRVVTSVAKRRLELPAWLRLIALGAVTAPVMGYQAWAIQQAGVWANRLQEPTLSGHIRTYLLGYGLVLLLALLAPLLPEARRRFATADTLRFLLVWAVVGIAVAYIPVNFQRKLIMGVHVPLCLLAGPALATLTARLSGDLPKIAVMFTVIATTPTHILNLLDTVQQLRTNAGSHRPYLTNDEAAALRWLHDNTRRNESVLVAPDPTSHRRLPGQALWPHLSVYVPAFAGNTVYDGHWSETASFGRKLNEAQMFFRADTPDAWRQEFLTQTGVTYVLYLNSLGQGEPPTDGTGAVFYDPVRWTQTPPPAYLQPVYANNEITLYRFHPEAEASSAPASLPAPAVE